MFSEHYKNKMRNSLPVGAFAIDDDGAEPANTLYSAPFHHSQNFWIRH